MAVGSILFWRYEALFSSLRQVVWSALVLMAVTLGGSTAQAEKVRLALNWKPEPEFGGFYAAQIDGAYKRQGLDVEIQPGGSGTPVVQMLAAGKAEFGIVSADEVVIARARGADVVALFAVYQTNPQGIMVRADRGFKNVFDVFKAEGILALQRGLPYAQFLLEKFQKSGGVLKAKIVPYPGGIAGFLNDPKYSQQVFVTSEPLEAQKKGLKVQSFLAADEGFNPYTAVVATSGEYLRKNRSTVQKMVLAVRQGWLAYLKDPSRANAEMATLNRAMDVATFADIARAQIPLIETAETKKNGLGTMTSERWNALIQSLVELKLISKAAPAQDHFLALPLQGQGG